MTHEEIRLRHRYLDLRRPRMQRNIRLRLAATRCLREGEQVTMHLSTPSEFQDFFGESPAARTIATPGTLKTIV